MENWRRTKVGKVVDWKYRLAYKEQQLRNLAKQWSRGDVIEICKIISDMERVNQNWLFAASSNTRPGASDEAGRWQVQNKHEEAALHTTGKGNSGTLRQGMLRLLKLHMDSGDNWTSWETGNPSGVDKQTETTSGAGSPWNTNCWSLGKSCEEASFCCYDTEQEGALAWPSIAAAICNTRHQKNRSQFKILRSLDTLNR